MKKIVSLIVIITLPIIISAKERVEENISTIYNSSSMSCVFVNRYTDNDDISKFYRSFEVSDKFDYNVIPTKFIAHNTIEPSTYQDISQNELFANLGREVVSSIFNRSENGTFNDSIIRMRGLYNANDQDIKNAAAVKVNDLSFEWGERLLNSAYIVVTDIYDAGYKLTERGNKKYEIRMVVHVFKLCCENETLDNFYQSAWIDEGMSEDEITQAKNNYDKMVFELSHVASVTSYGSSLCTKIFYGSYYSACNSAFRVAMGELEMKIPSWQSTFNITSTHPIEAKMGKKEGLKNGDRFEVYSFRENREGELESVKRGMVRATKVADNRNFSDGNSSTTCFYQISGLTNVKEGYTLKQKDDLQWGLAITGGTTTDNFRVGLDSDLILHIGKHGGITYAMLSAGVRTNKAMVTDAMLGLGYGIPLSRFLEITPSFLAGLYTPLKEKDAYGFDSTSGFALEPGVRLGLTFQPLTLYFNMGYQTLLSNDFIEKRSQYITTLGIKWTF